MRLLLMSFALVILTSCLENKSSSVDDFRVGKFKTELEDQDYVSVAVRNDSIQIESYNGKKDTFDISWLDPFEYVLLKKNPKNLLDSTAFHVKIISIGNDSYDFKAYYKGSKFQQKGTAFKID